MKQNFPCKILNISSLHFALFNSEIIGTTWIIFTTNVTDKHFSVKFFTVINFSNRFNGFCSKMFVSRDNRTAQNYFLKKNSVLRTISLHLFFTQNKCLKFASRNKKQGTRALVVLNVIGLKENKKIIRK